MDEDQQRIMSGTASVNQVRVERVMTRFDKDIDLVRDLLTEEGSEAFERVLRDAPTVAFENIGIRSPHELRSTVFQLVGAVHMDITGREKARLDDLLKDVYIEVLRIHRLRKAINTALSV